MDFWYVSTGVVALIVLFPYIRCFFKRLICMGKIKKVCHNKGYKKYVTHPVWFLCSQHTNEVYAIKLFGMPRRLSILVLKENGEYFIRSFIAMTPYGGVIHFPINGKPKPMPAYDFRYKYKDSGRSKPQDLFF